MRTDILVVIVLQNGHESGLSYLSYILGYICYGIHTIWDITTRDMVYAYIWLNGAPERKLLVGTIYGLSYWGGLGHIMVFRVIVTNCTYSICYSQCVNQVIYKLTKNYALNLMNCLIV